MMRAICLFVLLVLFLTQSCTKIPKGVHPPVDPPVEPPVDKKEFTFKVSGKTLVRFSKISGNNSSSGINENDTLTYFGSRVYYSIPKEIRIKENVLELEKPFGLVEKYIAKWEKDELFIKANEKDDWKMFGVMKGEDEFYLLLSFFFKTSLQHSVKSLVVGHEYNLKNFDVLLQNVPLSTELILLQYNILYK